jgi:hypothetical protein
MQTRLQQTPDHQPGNCKTLCEQHSRQARLFPRAEAIWLAGPRLPRKKRKKKKFDDDEDLLLMIWP